MTTHSPLLLAAVTACSFEGFEPQYQLSPNWGKITVSVGTFGQSVYDRNDYIVSLDSAIQGYGARRITSNGDTVQITPILAGRHQVILRGAKPNCEVEGGTVREFTMVAGAHISVGFRVFCEAALDP